MQSLGSMTGLIGTIMGLNPLWLEALLSLAKFLDYHKIRNVQNSIMNEKVWWLVGEEATLPVPSWERKREDR